MDGQPARLKTLLQERHWQKYSTFCREYQKAARAIDSILIDSCPSRAQLHRWMSGQLKGLPYPDACRVLEQMFPGWTARQLMQPCDSDPGGGEQLNRPTTQLTQIAQNVALGSENPGSTRLIESVPHSFSADKLDGLWVTAYQFNTDLGIQRHADITQLTHQSSRRVTAKNHPPDPRAQGHLPSFRNEIEAQLANRHLIGHWRNISDTRYFGSIHLAVLPGETIMEGYYTGLSSDIKVEAMSWKWIRLDPASLSGVKLSQVVLKEPDTIYALLENSAHNEPVTLAAVAERSNER